MICPMAGICSNFIHKCEDGTAEYALRNRLQVSCSYNHLPEGASCDKFVGASTQEVAYKYTSSEQELAKHLILAAEAAFPAQC